MRRLSRWSPLQAACGILLVLGAQAAPAGQAHSLTSDAPTDSMVAAGGVQADAPLQSDPPAQADVPAEAAAPIQADAPAQADVSAQTAVPVQGDVPAQTAVPVQADVPAQAAAPAQTTSDLQVATVVDDHLPTWVQVVVASAPLYASDSGSNQVGPKLSRYVYLRVLASGASRLQVQAYDEGGTPGQIGWVDPNQVLPSAPGIDWLVSSIATRLWSSADPSADALRNLDRFTPLQKIGDPVQGRIQVRVYRSDFSAIVDQGWVNASDTGPALAPQMRVPAPTDRTTSLRAPSTTNPGTTNLQRAFLDSISPAARDAAGQTGVPASVTVAQAILESDWGRSALAQTANNYFGMKAMGTMGSDGVVYLPTSEYDSSGQLYQTVSAFRAYKSLTDSLADHDRLLATSSRYAAAMRVANDPKQFAAMLQQAGYSTDPTYADKLVSLMDRYNLYQLDKA